MKKQIKKKKEFLQESIKISDGIKGGLAGHLKRLRNCFMSAGKEGYCPHKGAVAIPQFSHQLKFTDSKDDFERIIQMQRAGTHWLHSCAFVLMAGGTGRRLGIKGAKLAQTAETATNNTLLEHFITHILAFQYEAKKLPSDKPFDYIPIVIMTSDESHQEVQDLLKENKNFGMPQGQCRLMLQPKIFMYKDSKCDPLRNDKDDLVYQTKSPGSGGIHYQLTKDPALLNGWLEKGIEQICFFPDNNLLGLHGVLEALAFSHDEKLDVNFIAVPRKADNQSSNPIMELKGKSGGLADKNYVAVIPAEYVPLVWKENKVKDTVTTDGFSSFPNSTGTMICELKSYMNALNLYDLPEYLKPDYKDENTRKSNTLKNPDGPTTYHESITEIIPLAVTDRDARVGFTEFPEWMCFAPLYNGWDEAKALQKANQPQYSMATAEGQYYYYMRRILAYVGGKLEVEAKDVPMSGGLPMKGGPRVVLQPSFAISISVLQSRFKIMEEKKQ